MAYLIYLITGISLTVYVVLAWIGSRFLGLTDNQFYLIFAILTALGTVLAGLVVWWQMKRAAKKAEREAEEAETDAGSGDEVDLLVRDAESKLAASRVAHGSKMGALPLIYVLGEQGSTKTHAVLHSGIEPELLAGHVFQENNIVPTRTGNLWFARDTIIVEPSSKILRDANAWTKLVRRLRPRALKSVVGGSTQAPRAVLLCVDSEIFIRQGAQDALSTLARNYHIRLGEISQTLGISFPLYVVFTRADRLPFFAEYMRTLTNDEATQVFGATLPLRQKATGIFAEEQGNRLNDAFNALFHSLADHRIEFLPREDDQEKVPGAYEFPREFRKLRAPLVQFLIDVCRPSALRTNPFLRGFYFAGVRPVVVSEMAVDARPAPQQRHAVEAGGSATGIFSIPQMQQAAPQPVPHQFVGSKKVPQWMFLPRLWHQVILQDHAAMGAAGSSTKTSTLQRILLAAGALACLLLALVFTISYFQNRALASDAITAAEAIRPSEAEGTALPSVDALNRLETLRQVLERLTVYKTDGSPFSMGWGLYTGDDLYPHVRRTYYDRFKQLLFGNAQGNLVRHMQRLPVLPGQNDDYGVTYDILKGYLITTSHNEKVSDSSPAPVLLTRWSEGRGVDTQRMELARKQFVFYANDLKNGNPYSSQGDELAVSKARQYLAGFSGFERVYQFMLGAAGKKSVNYNREIQGSSEAVLNNRDVPAAFTKAGYALMADNLRQVDKFFSGEEWVLGKVEAAKIDRTKLAQDLSARYVTDYITQWRNYFKATKVLPYKDVKDAASKLNLQAGPASPILGVFWLASQHTGVDPTKVVGADKIKQAFRASHHVVAPTADAYAGGNNQQYFSSLVTLQSSVGQAAELPVPTKAIADTTLQNASAAKISVRQMSPGFGIDNEAHLESITSKLLEEPITNVETLLRGMGPAELNAAGKSFCAEANNVLMKFPFNLNGKTDATLQETNGLLRPNEGSFWAFYQASIAKLAPLNGDRVAPTGEVQITPQFVNFLNSMVALSRAMYKPGPDPKLTYMVRPISAEGSKDLALVIDGQTMPFTGGQAKQLTWPGSGQAGLTGTIEGGPIPRVSYEGLWAPFHLFADAEVSQPAGAGYNFEYPIKVSVGKSARELGRARFYVEPWYFRKGVILTCPTPVAK